MLSNLRLKSGYSQNQLAKRSGVPLRTIQMYENGQRTLSKANIGTIYKLSQVLECPMDTLMVDLVTDQNGNELAWNDLVQIMDDDLREELHAELSPCSSQVFFDAYVIAHKEKFDEDWEFNK